MILCNVSLDERSAPVDIFTDKGWIREIKPAGTLQNTHATLKIDGTGCRVWPGLINSHDHPDFNLFPQLGDKRYNDYTEWGPSIQQEFAPLIEAVKKVPEELRARWGLYKNLLNGCTTVVNHGKRLPFTVPFMDVYEKAQSLHSPAFEKNWKWKLNNPLRRNQPVCIHLGEGTGTRAKKEIDELLRFNRLRRKIMAVHGVALQTGQARGLSGLIWCPASNYFLFGETANVKALSAQLPVMLGTDSTLTASWNLFDHLRLAQSCTGFTDQQLINLLTAVPARVWSLPDTGMVAENKIADLVVIKMPEQKLANSNPEDIMLVLKKGVPVLADPAFLPVTDLANETNPLSDTVMVGGKKKRVIAGLIGLMEQIKRFYPGAVFPVSAVPGQLL